MNRLVHFERGDWQIWLCSFWRGDGQNMQNKKTTSSTEVYSLQSFAYFGTIDTFLYNPIMPA